MVAARLKCEVEGIQDVRSRRGLFGWLRSGREAVRRELPAIRPTLKDPGEYELVVLGSPVWAGTVASPLRTYIAQNQGRFKRIAVFATCGGVDADRALQEIAELCGQRPLATRAFRNREVRAGTFASTVEEFAAAI